MLTDKRADIAVSYQAAVAIINDDVLPDRLALAAHALRELMEKLPNNGAAIDMGADLNTKVNALRKPWDDAVAEDGAHGGEAWRNGIGAALCAFLGAVGGFSEDATPSSQAGNSKPSSSSTGLTLRPCACPRTCNVRTRRNGCACADTSTTSATTASLQRRRTSWGGSISLKGSFRPASSHDPPRILQQSTPCCRS